MSAITTMVTNNLQKTRADISRLEMAYQRDTGSVTLLAVSKRKPLSDIREAIIAGQTAFGENYAEEGAEKAASLGQAGIDWHFIGHIQSNKTRLIARHYSWVQSADRAKIIERLAMQRPDELPPLNVCIQVNIDDEAGKSGCQPADLLALARLTDSKPNLILRGIMAIPAPPASIEAQRQIFRNLHELYESLKETFATVDTLSMGMTADMEAAIAEGATMVRVGTAIFGRRE